MFPAATSSLYLPGTHLSQFVAAMAEYCPPGHFAQAGDFEA